MGEPKGRPRMLRLDLPGYGSQDLTPVDWKDWFRTFDEPHLVMYQEQLRNRRHSNFFRLDSPEREDG